MSMMDFIVAFTELSDARCFLREVGGQGRVSNVVEHLHILTNHGEDEGIKSSLCMYHQVN